MIEHTYKELYDQDSVDKQIVIAFDGGELTNEDLYSESFELEESLCSEEELRFGSCEAGTLKFKIANTVDSLKDKWVTVTEILSGMTDDPFQFGKYKVYSDVPSGDRNYRNVTAYDAMYDIINADVTEWYESLEFPMTLKEFRDSFFVYMGIEQEDTVLIHDDLEIEKTITGTGISGKLIITSICELNGVFGHINRIGNFAYISLSEEVTVVDTYISCEYEDFETGLITKLQIRQEENDIGAVAGDGENCYIIEDNFLIYGKDSESLQTIAEAILQQIQSVSYRPFNAQMQGNPCFEVGDQIYLRTKNKDVISYILKRTLKGIQGLKDTFESEGVLSYSEKVNSIQKDIQQLKGKSNVLERTVEKTRSEISDVESGLRTEIQQTAEDITTVVENLETEFNTRMEQTESEFAFNFEGVKSEVDNLEAQTQEEFQKYSQYIRFVNGNIILGKSDNPITLRIENDKIVFLEDNVEIGYWRNRKFYAVDGEFIGSIKIGDFLQKIETDGSLSLW